MASYDSVDYSVRIKKNIERKLLVDLLNWASHHLPIKDYRYVGMGSLWFTDFIVFHRALGITKMLSVEDKDIGYSRARVNRPFGFVRVEKGDIRAVLARTLAVSKRVPVVSWMDYDSDLSKGIVDDILDVAAHARHGDILIVTANAGLHQLGSASAKQEGEVENNYQRRIFEEKRDRFESMAKGLVKINSPSDLYKDRFSVMVAQALIAAVNSGCNASGQGLTFDCLFNFQYADGAPMVTVGGIVQRQSERQVSPEHLQTVPSFAKGAEQVSIDVPILTYREKARLDRAIKAAIGKVPTEATLGFKLEKGQAKKYVDYYRYYPMFGEVLF